MEMTFYAVKLGKKWYDFEHNVNAGSFRPACLCVSKERAPKKAKLLSGKLTVLQLKEI
jgi:hypothetical protein